MLKEIKFFFSYLMIHERCLCKKNLAILLKWICQVAAIKTECLVCCKTTKIIEAKKNAWLLFHFNELAVFWTIFIFAYSVIEEEVSVFQNNTHLDSLKSFGFMPVIFCYHSCFHG